MKLYKKKFINDELQVFVAPAFDDKILEVVAVYGTVQMAASRVINLQHHRIAQVCTFQIFLGGKFLIEFYVFPFLSYCY